MMHLLRLASLFLSFFVLVLSGCLVAAEPDVEEAASPISGDGASGGESGGGGGTGGGGEPIGVAQEAVAGCCCEVPVGEGKAGKCRNVDDPSQCKYEEYKEGRCNPLPEPICSVSGAVGDGGHGVIASVEGFALFFALALAAVVRRRAAAGGPSFLRARGQPDGIEGAPMTDVRG